MRNQPFELFPDFPTGGLVDVTRYNDGLRGGSIRVRARIKQLDKKTLVITEVPFSTTTSSLIESILKANDKGKIKIRKIEDNTSASVEILVHLQPGISLDKTIDALYAFTDCDIPISPNSCVIDDNCPRFVGVSQLLKTSTNNTLNLLKQELEIQLSELEDDWHYSSLEKIFFEERLYRELEKIPSIGKPFWLTSKLPLNLTGNCCGARLYAMILLSLPINRFVKYLNSI